MLEIAFLFAAKEKREVKPRWPKIPEQAIRLVFAVESNLAHTLVLFAVKHIELRAIPIFPVEHLQCIQDRGQIVFGL